MSLAIVPMRRRHLRQVLAIEHEVFPEPWSKAVLTSELSFREGRAYRVAQERRTIVGYFGLMFVGEEAHVTTVAVHPSHQHGGVGTTLLLEATRISLASGCKQVSLEVAADNTRAQALYQRFGFVPVGIRKGYYQKTGQDAFVMWVYDIDSPKHTARLAAIEAGLRCRR